MELEKERELEKRLNDLQRQLNEVRAELELYKAQSVSQKELRAGTAGNREPVLSPQAAGTGEPEVVQQAAGYGEPEVVQQAAVNREPEQLQQPMENRRPDTLQQTVGTGQPEISPETGTAGSYTAPQKPVKANAEAREAGLGKMAMGIGAILLILISFSLFGVAVLPLLSNPVKAVLLFAFNAGLLAAGTALHKKAGWWVIPECIGLVGLYLSILISHITLEVLPISAVYVCLVLWIIVSSVYAYQRELVFAIIAQVGLFTSEILLLDQIESLAMADRGAAAWRFALVLLVVENILLYITLSKKKFAHAVPVYLGEFCILISSTVALSMWSDKESYRWFVLALVCAVNVRQYLLRPLVDRVMTGHGHTVFMLYYTGVLFFFEICALLSMGGSTGMEEMDGLTMVIRSATVVAAFAAGTAILSLYRDSFGYRPRLGMANYHIVQTGMLLTALFTIPSLQEESVYYAPCAILCNAGLFCVLAVLDQVERIRVNAYYPVIFCLIYGLFGMHKDNPVYAKLSICFMLAVAGTAAYRYLRKRDWYTDAYYTVVHSTVILSLTALIVGNAYCIEDRTMRHLSYTVCCLCMMGLNLLESKCRYMSNRVARYAVSAFSSFVFFITGSKLDGLLFWIFAFAVILVQLTLHTKELLLAEQESKNPSGIVICIKYTLFVMYLLSESSAVSIVYSIVFILVSAVCVMAGMRFRAKSMRIYGLVLSMISIFKLVMLDIYYDSLAMRALSFLVAGLICLGVSYAYGRFEKTFSGQDEDME